MRLAPLFLAVVALGCASSSSIKTTSDEFEGGTTTAMTYNPLAGSSLLDDSQVRFRPTKHVTDDGTVIFAIAIQVYGNSSGWCFIEAGESLHFIVDGERHHLSSIGGSGGTGGSREVLSEGGTKESAIYRTTPEFLRLLASAGEVRVRVDGSRRQIERHFSEANSENLREFVAQVVDVRK